MRRKPVLLRKHQIGRQQENSVGAGALGRLRHFHGDGRAVTGAGEHRKPAAHLVGGCAYNVFDLGRAQREELAGAAGGEQAGDVVARQPGEVVAVSPLVERQR